MAKIHPMAVVEAGAELADDVEVGPFAYIGPHVRLGKGCIVHHHAMIEGHTSCGEGNVFYPNAILGGEPQDLKYKGAPCKLLIGSYNKFRENVTIHIGTEDGGGYTRIGNHNLIMVGTHIAHDCEIGSHCILANNVMLAGHVMMEDYVVVSGGAGSHHFVRFGQHSFVGGLAGVTKDVPPFMIVDGHPGSVRGVNFNGLKRRGFSREQMEPLKAAYKLLFKDLTPMITQMGDLEKMFPESRELQMLLEFLRDSLAGKFGRYRETLRGKLGSAGGEDEEAPPHVSGN